MRVWRWRARLSCHGTVLCCQYVDGPQCNSSRDPHRFARRLHHRRERQAINREGDWT